MGSLKWKIEPPSLFYNTKLVVSFPIWRATWACSAFSTLHNDHNVAFYITLSSKCRPNTYAYISLNSLWPNDSVWGHWYGSTLTQLMAWWLRVQSHWLNECWPIVGSVIYARTHFRGKGVLFSMGSENSRYQENGSLFTDKSAKFWKRVTFYMYLFRSLLLFKITKASPRG